MNDPIYFAAAGDIANLAASSAQTALDSTQVFWDGMYNGSGVFGRICKFCLGLAFLFVVYRAYDLYQEYREHFDYSKIISSLLVPIIILCMLSSSGAIAKGFTRGLRTLTADFGGKIVSGAGHDILTDNVKTTMPPGMKSNAIFKQFIVDMDKCRVDPDPIGCSAVAAAKMNQKINAMPDADPLVVLYAQDLTKQVKAKLVAASGAQNSGVNWDSVMGIFSKGLPSLGDIGEQIVITLLNAIVICFYWAIELASLLAFYLFPVALTMAIIDKKAIVDWFTSYWALCNAKICFAIVLALIGQVSTAMQGASFVVELLGAFFAPIITFMMAKGSALAMAEGFQGAASGAVMGAATGAGKKFNERYETNKSDRKAGKTAYQQSQGNYKGVNY
jgi:hypothetical protein